MLKNLVLFRSAFNMNVSRRKTSWVFILCFFAFLWLTEVYLIHDMCDISYRVTYHFKRSLFNQILFTYSLLRRRKRYGIVVALRCSCRKMLAWLTVIIVLLIKLLDWHSPRIIHAWWPAWCNTWMAAWPPTVWHNYIVDSSLGCKQFILTLKHGTKCILKNSVLTNVCCAEIWWRSAAITCFPQF